MSGIFSTAGAVVYIGNPTAAKSTDFVTADFSSHSFVAIGWLENIGQFGDESPEVTFAAIGEGRMQKLKGVRDAGTMNLVCGIDHTDEGQANLRIAQRTASNYSFKVEFNDEAVGGQPSTRTFIAMVMSVREQLDTANSVAKLNAALAINSNIVVVDAVP